MLTSSVAPGQERRDSRSLSSSARPPPSPATVAVTTPAIPAGGSCSSATTRSIRCSSPPSSARRTRRRSSSARCSGRAPRAARQETLRALRSAISKKADGIAVSIVDDKTFAPQADAAVRAGIPLVAFNVDSGSSSRRFAYVGENPRASGARVGAEVARLAPRSNVLLFAPERAQVWTERRLQGLIAGLAGAKAPAAIVVRLSGDVRSQQSAVEKAYQGQRGLRGLFAVDGTGTVAVGRAIERLGLRAKGVRAAGTTCSRATSSSSPTGRSTSSSTSSRTSRASRRCCSSSSRGSPRERSSPGTPRPRCSCARRM